MPSHPPFSPSCLGPAAVLLAAITLATGHPSRSAAQPASRPDRVHVVERILQHALQADTDGDGTLDAAEVRAFMQQRRDARGDAGANRPAPTESDLSYGDHERHRIDLYLPPDAKGPTPLVVYYHGGGFTSGDKARVSPALIAAMHQEGIAVAAANYRLCTTDPLPAAMHDGARAIQTLRARADRFNLDPGRIAVTGASAGAGIALWIALHDDLADPASDDPVARQSTRVTVAQVQQAQVTYDPRAWIELGLERAVNRRPFPELFGHDAQTPYESPDLAAAAEASSPLHFLTADDPPLRFDYGVGARLDANTPIGNLIHHPNHGLAMQQACQPLGVPCEVHHAESGPPAETAEAFLIRHLQPG